MTAPPTLRATAAGPPLLLHVFSTFAVSGPQVRFAAIAKRFGRRWRHAVIAMDHNHAARALLAPDLEVAFPDFEPRGRDTLGNLRRIRRVLLAWRPDLLVTSNWGTVEWGLANACLPWSPLVPHLHMEDGFGPEERARQLPRRVWTRRLALRRAQLLVPSRVLHDVALGIWRLPSARVTLVANGVDFRLFVPRPPPEAEAGAGDLTIGTVAALRPEKNIGRLLEALAHVPRLPVFRHGMPRLVIVGDGPERAALEARAARPDLAGRVVFAGHHANPSAFYTGFDIFALSSDTEQMPLSLLEAMASGLPVAATDVGDVAAMLSPENRPFVARREAASLAASLGAMAADPALRVRLGAANRREATARFDQEAMFAAHAALWDGIARPSTCANTSSWPALVSSQPNRSA